MLGLVLHATHWEWELLTGLDLDHRWLDIVVVVSVDHLRLRSR
jgi:hypothetical protein